MTIKPDYLSEGRKERRKINLSGDDDGPVLATISSKITKCIIADVGQNSNGAGKRITYTLKIEFTGSPKIIGLLVNVANLDHHSISPFKVGCAV